MNHLSTKSFTAASDGFFTFKDLLIESFPCDKLGVIGSTDVHVREREDGTFEARVGKAHQPGICMTPIHRKGCCNDPFHRWFFDAYSKGVGKTKEEALENLKLGMAGALPKQPSNVIRLKKGR